LQRLRRARRARPVLDAASNEHRVRRRADLPGAPAGRPDRDRADRVGRSPRLADARPPRPGPARPMGPDPNPADPSPAAATTRLSRWLPPFAAAAFALGV